MYVCVGVGVCMNECVCMYACMFVCMCICMHVCVCICIIEYYDIKSINFHLSLNRQLKYNLFLVLSSQPTRNPHINFVGFLTLFSIYVSPLLQLHILTLNITPPFAPNIPIAWTTMPNRNC
uniref:Uncharacterized protein n=1 Tax=Octopus bimaculoides TaxID=37653 RepID=A0A0L8FV41_OCTBM